MPTTTCIVLASFLQEQRPLIDSNQVARYGNPRLDCAVRGCHDELVVQEAPAAKDPDRLRRRVLGERHLPGNLARSRVGAADDALRRSADRTAATDCQRRLATNCME